MALVSKPLSPSAPGIPTPARLLVRPLLLLAIPVLAEHLLHIFVGLNDTWLANQLAPDIAPAATAAIGTITYILWFVGLIVGAVATGSTAIIARAKGANHRSLANSVTGQSVSAAAALGLAFALVVFVAAAPIVHTMNLSPQAAVFALDYLRLLAWCVPFLTVMFVANACLRGAGDTISPAVSMIVVDVINVAFSYGLTFGKLGMPRLGFRGIAIGTVIAYAVGGIMMVAVLLAGRGGTRLHLHRMRMHWQTMRRILRIGVPAGVEGLLAWLAQYGVVTIINGMDASSIAAAAHINTVRIESVSYMVGMAFATAAATLVGQSLGRRVPADATRSTFLAYAIGGGFMTVCGLAFVFFGQYPARWMSPNNPEIADLTRQCLRIAGCIQAGFAAAAIFGGALRGAGDTLVVMVINLVSVFSLRLAGVIYVTRVLHYGLPAIWFVLSAELFIRGTLIFLRFLQGRWKTVRV